jgi:Ser/Thr protein kinase RdoA (MazF antagonist)
MNTADQSLCPVMGALCDLFGLGAPTGEPRAVPGGLSNRLWRCRTDRGTFAVKVMVVNATTPDFVANVEAAFAVERVAVEAGVPAPRPVPVPASGRCLAEVPTMAGGTALVRVHEWVDAVPVAEPSPRLAARLGLALGRLHAVPMWHAAPALPPLATFGGDHWADLAGRARVEAAPYALELAGLLPVLADLEALVIESLTAPPSAAPGHRDADPKNCIDAGTRGLLLVDWDAAGPVVPAHEVAAAVLDWSGAATGEPVLGVARALVEGYRRAGGTTPVADERAFAAWLAGTLGWLEFNVRDRLLGAPGDDGNERALGKAEVRWAVTHLPRVARSLPAWVRLLAL